MIFRFVAVCCRICGLPGPFVQVGPVTLGLGKSPPPRRILHPRLRLTAVRQMGESMVELRYAVQPQG